MVNIRHLIKKIYVRGDDFTIKWIDNSTTTVTRAPEDTDDMYVAFCAAIAKKLFDSTAEVCRFLIHNMEVQDPDPDLLEIHFTLPLIVSNETN